MTDDDRTAAFPGRDHGSMDSEPLDVTAVRADDALLDALSRDRLPGGWELTDADHQLAAMLAGWRHDIDARPMPLHPTVDEVEAEIARLDRSTTQRTAFRRLRYVAGAAAVAVVAFGAVTVLAQNAEPGDPLWNVKETMFGSEASATIASSNVQSNMEKAEQALAGGDKRAAAEYLVAAQKDVGKMSGTDAKQRMQDWAQRLAEQVGPIPQNPLSAISSLPLPSTLPSISVPSELTAIPSIPTSQNVDPRMLLRAPVTPPKTTPAAPPSQSSEPSESETTTTTTTTPVG
ncbi:anti-sigma-D factor RsdA [Williamsia serinedens]|uniref:Anti-sigma-D factor RsdA to sigma factor binding region n=1 Tax=Williamsia serinedens TaxID=391736 RepID=A0ABT1GZI4_9NOCA|nr:anti-sigma-D factor RsdA [Williamsia serinedens]MCP2160401.1 Anti-sigma-D factor RsdA to sigma factor binding region [Williamsia serinedens]